MPASVGEVTVAVLVASHNRAEKTRRCLESLRKAAAAANVAVKLYWVDDGCTDDSRAVVMEAYPDVRVVEGDGNLFWARGMAAALARFRAAGARENHVLLLNDDVVLHEHAIDTLLAGSNRHPDAVLCGSVSDSAGVVTYGGYERRHRTVRLLLRRVLPDGDWRAVDTLNGNVVWLPREAALRYGLDGGFRHGYADIDLGLRVTRSGGSVLLAPTVVGVCEEDHPATPWREASLTLSERWSMLRSTKHRPAADRARFLRRHARRRYWILAALPYLDVAVTHARRRLLQRK